MKRVITALAKSKAPSNVRGKLNVPRERFRQRDAGYIWAGKD